MVCSISESISTRGGVNSDHTTNGVSTQQGTLRTSIVVILVYSILKSIYTRGGVNSKGHTRGGVNSEVYTRGGVNSDHTANGMSTEQCTFRTSIVVIPTVYYLPSKTTSTKVTTIPAS